MALYQAFQRSGWLRAIQIAIAGARDRFWHPEARFPCANFSVVCMRDHGAVNRAVFQYEVVALDIAHTRR